MLHVVPVPLASSIQDLVSREQRLLVLSQRRHALLQKMVQIQPVRVYQNPHLPHVPTSELQLAQLRRVVQTTTALVLLHLKRSVQLLHRVVVVEILPTTVNLQSMELATLQTTVNSNRTRVQGSLENLPVTPPFKPIAQVVHLGKVLSQNSLPLQKVPRLRLVEMLTTAIFVLLDTSTRIRKLVPNVHCPLGARKTLRSPRTLCHSNATRALTDMDTRILIY